MELQLSDSDSLEEEDSAAVAIATESCRQPNPRSIKFCMICKAREEKLIPASDRYYN